MISLEELKNKKIALLGFGTEGQSTAIYLAKHNLSFSILDQDEKVTIPETLRPHLLETILGENYLNFLNKFDVVIRSPGIRLSMPSLQAFKNAGGQLTSQIKMFFDLTPASIIGVTGTKGKGTTSTLIYELMKTSGKNVFLGGNIGSPPLDFLDNLTEADWVILELSSFQLADLHASPKIAVVLMITVDHLDYHMTEGAYWDAKSNLVRHQTQTDLAVICHDYPTSLSFSHKTKAKVIYTSRKGRVTPGVYVQDGAIVSENQTGHDIIMKTSEVGLTGDFNLENICAAVAVAKSVNIDNSAISEVVSAFKGLPHRLEFCREINGVSYYNDSASTNPETTIAAIRSFNQPLVLILGGSSKQADFTKLGQEIAFNTNVTGVLLIGEEARSIEEAIQINGTFRGFILKDLKSMQEVVETASKLVSHNGVVLLSPACASFGLFKNYHERGEQFKIEVARLPLSHETN